MTSFTFILFFVISNIMIGIVFYVVQNIREQIRVIKKEIEEEKSKEDIKLLYKLEIAIEKRRQLLLEWIDIYQAIDKAEKPNIKLINKALELKELIQNIEKQIKILEAKRKLL